MAKRDNHYEAAFEGYLQAQRIPYVAVDEARRSALGDASLKNLDFLVSPPQSERTWLVDVKGRRFPAGRQKQYWKNWSTQDDLRSMASWEQLFGSGFGALFVFAYHLTADVAPVSAEQVFPFRGRLYAFVGIRLDLYASWARPISVRWQTMAMPTARFRELAQPWQEFLKAKPKPAPRYENCETPAFSLEIDDEPHLSSEF